MSAPIKDVGQMIELIRFLPKPPVIHESENVEMPYFCRPLANEPGFFVVPRHVIELLAWLQADAEGSGGPVKSPEGIA